MVSALSAHALDHVYPDGLRAVAGVDVDLGRGELVCLLGPNGSGKSTLLKLLGGVLHPTAGAVRVADDLLTALATRERARRIASVPQVLRALPEMRVESFVLGGRYPYLGPFGRARAEDRAAVRRALEATDATPWRERNLGELSGGEAQRVLIARALAQEARVLLFDEPTASLDPEHQVRVFELIARLVADGRSVLVATHELNLASRYADRIVILDEGRVAARGEPGEVLRPAVLEPIYGKHLRYVPTPGGEDRPLVVPWPRRGVGGG